MKQKTPPIPVIDMADSLLSLVLLQTLEELKEKSHGEKPPSECSTRDILLTLKKAKAPAVKMDTDTRIKLVERAVNITETLLERCEPNETFKGFGNTRAEADAALGEMKRWLDLLKTVPDMDTPEKFATFSEHWNGDSPFKVESDTKTRTGTRVRKAYREAWIRQCLLVLPNAKQSDDSTRSLEQRLAKLEGMIMSGDAKME